MTVRVDKNDFDDDAAAGVEAIQSRIADSVSTDSVAGSGLGALAAKPAPPPP